MTTRRAPTGARALTPAIVSAHSTPFGGRVRGRSPAGWRRYTRPKRCYPRRTSARGPGASIFYPNAMTNQTDGTEDRRRAAGGGRPLRALDDRWRNIVVFGSRQLTTAVPMHTRHVHADIVSVRVGATAHRARGGRCGT
ncbi:hypothetical protein EVAR_86195_1 [Eumeta japonica]|uniref:Uncharacterized protein n=1 Tax=Eumeta variegata TaxID=151549 RepID=A0A4C1UCG7_EUMVA|nr:hypothetical protein EVAR_86195_1 [Eumeta japonica]